MKVLSPTEQDLQRVQNVSDRGTGLFKREMMEHAIAARDPWHVEIGPVYFDQRGLLRRR